MKKYFKSEEKARKVGEKIWAELHAFGSYAFPKAHSSGYGIIANATQFLKVKFPVEFFCSLLDQAEDDKYEVIKNIAEKNYGIKFIMPDINLSRLHFTIYQNKIVWPFTSIKGIGLSASSEIIKHQPYDSFEEFYSSIKKRTITIKIVRLLVTAKAFSSIDRKRNRLMRKYYKLHKIDEEYKPLTGHEWDFEASKIMPYFKQSIEKLFPEHMRHVTTYEKFLAARNGKRLILAGTVSFIRHINSKRGKMAIINLTNSGEKYNVVLWSDMIKRLEKKRIKLEKDMALKISGFKSLSKMGEEQLTLGSEPEAYIKVLG